MSQSGFGSTGSVASCGTVPVTNLPIPPSCGSSLNLLHWLWHGSRSQSNFYSDVALMSASGFGSTGSFASCGTTSPPPYQHQPASKSEGI